MIELKNQDGKHQVVFAADGVCLYESSDRTAALRRASILSGLADRRGARATSSDLLVLFPPSAPAPLILSAALSAEAQPKREDVFHAPSGTWSMKHVEVFRSGVALKAGKPLTFTTDDVMDFVEAFATLGWQPPLKIGHNDEQPLLDGLTAIGRVTALRAAEVKGSDGATALGLFADLERVPNELREAIRTGALYQRSIEFWRNVSRPTGGGTLPLVLKAVALLGADLPAVRGMPPLDIAPATFAEAASHEFATTPMETSPVTTPDPKAGQTITLSAADYEALKTSQTEAEQLKADLKAQQDRLNRLEIDRRVEGATNVATRLRTEGKIAPAQEANVVELLKALDDDNREAVTLSSTDGSTTRTEKLSARAAFVKLLDSMPKQAGAPGAPGSSGNKAQPANGSSEFASLSAEDQGKAVAKLGEKYAEQSKAKTANEFADAYDKARKDLVSGTAKLEA
jgi:hypothetical protein